MTGLKDVAFPLTKSIIVDEEDDLKQYVRIILNKTVILISCTNLVFYAISGVKGTELDICISRVSRSVFPNHELVS